MYVLKDETFRKRYNFNAPSASPAPGAATENVAYAKHMGMKGYPDLASAKRLYMKVGRPEMDLMQAQWPGLRVSVSGGDNQQRVEGAVPSQEEAPRNLN